MSDMDKSREELVRELADLRERLRSRVSERKCAAEALDREPDKFRTLAEKAPVGLAIIAEGGSFTYENPAFVDMFGSEPDEIPNGKAWFRQAHPDPEHRKQVIDAWKSDLEKSFPDTGRPRVFSVVCKDRSEKIVRFRAVRPAGDGRVMPREDITDRKQAEHALHEHVSMPERILETDCCFWSELGVEGAKAGFAAMRHVPEMGRSEITSVASEEISCRSTISADGWSAYRPPGANGHDHEYVALMRDKAGLEQLKWVHTLIANIKGNMRGVHHGSGRKHLGRCPGEFRYRLNRTFQRSELSDRTLVTCAGAPTINPV